MYIHGNFGSETLLLSFKRREGWESERRWIKRDFWNSGWAEDPNLSQAWADFKVKSGCLGLCPVVSDTSKDTDYAYHSVCPFSSLWPSLLERFSFLTSNQISLNFSFCLLCQLPQPFAMYFQEASGSIFPVTICMQWSTAVISPLSLL